MNNIYLKLQNPLMINLRMKIYGLLLSRKNLIGLNYLSMNIYGGAENGFFAGSLRVQFFSLTDIKIRPMNPKLDFLSQNLLSAATFLKQSHNF